MRQTPPTPHAARAAGEARRDAGMSLAARRRQRLIWQAQVALIDAILSSPHRTATTDSIAADLGAKHADGGRWMGTVPRELALLNLIEKAGVVLSDRSARHRGYLTLWRGLDDADLASHRDYLCRLLANAEELPEPTLFD